MIGARANPNCLHEYGTPNLHYDQGYNDLLDNSFTDWIHLQIHLHVLNPSIFFHDLNPSIFSFRSERAEFNPFLPDGYLTPVKLDTNDLHLDDV